MRVVVTGVGLVTAIGNDAEGSWAALTRGERGLRPITLFDATGQRAWVVGSVSAIASDPKIARQDPAWSRTTGFALMAAREALGRARIAPGTPRGGLVIGATTGGMFETEARLAELHADPDARAALSEMLSHPITSTEQLVARALGPFDRRRTLSSACSSGAVAIALGAAWLVAGDVDWVLCGGTDALCRLTLSGFNALGATDPEPCRPFDASRAGLNLGEGAGFVVLERMDASRSRAPSPLCELKGWAIAAEAHHITNPEPTGRCAGEMIRKALRRAELSPERIDFVSAHGTATKLNDVMEGHALCHVMGDRARQTPVSSQKGQIGHTLGAAGAIEAAFTALAIRDGIVPGTAGLVAPDPACLLENLPTKAERRPVRAALSNAFGFGGMDATLVFTEPELAPESAPRKLSVAITQGIAWNGVRTGDLAWAATLAAGAPGGGPPLESLDEALDPDRTRRMDDVSRRTTACVSRLVHRAMADRGQASPAGSLGVLLGSAFGNVDGSAAFMHRVFARGPRWASPLEFPNLLPSSPVGHASIYLGAAGPAMATADLSASGEAAISTAFDWVRFGIAERMVAGSVAHKSAIVERVLYVLLGDGRHVAGRAREGGAVLHLEAIDDGAPLPTGCVRLEIARSWLAGDTVSESVVGRYEKGARLLVDAGLRVEQDGPWEAAEPVTLGDAFGEHHARGALALAYAAGLCKEGVCPVAVVVTAHHAFRLVKA